MPNTRIDLKIPLLTQNQHSVADRHVREVPLGDSGTRYSITSSARCCRMSGTSSPSAFAVLRLTIISNLLGKLTGRSAGFPPLRILSTYAAVSRKNAPAEYDIRPPERGTDAADENEGSRCFVVRSMASLRTRLP